MAEKDGQASNHDQPRMRIRNQSELTMAAGDIQGRDGRDGRDEREGWGGGLGMMGPEQLGLARSDG